MKSLFDYKNYRSFLKDYYLNEKKKKSGFTYSSFAKKAGIKSANFYKLIMDGEKNLTLKTIPLFANALELSDGESHYFETMVHYNQSKKAVEKDYYKKRLIKLRERHISELKDILFLDETEFKNMDNWLYYALMVLTAKDDFKEDPEWVKDQLYNVVNDQTISQIFKKLKQMNILGYNDKKQLKQVKGQVYKLANMKEMSTQQFFKSLSIRAVSAYNLSDPAEMVNGVLVIPVGEKQVKVIREKIKEFFKELNEYLLEEDCKDRIYAIQASCFPISK